MIEGTYPFNVHTNAMTPLMLYKHALWLEVLAFCRRNAYTSAAVLIRCSML